MPTPTRDQLLAAASKRLPDVIAPNLTVLFCGINPGLYSAFTGNHFARPGNRFWPALFAGGFTERLYHPSEERLLLGRGYGITNVAGRASAKAEELSEQELLDGGKRLRAKVRRYKPRCLAVLGVGAFRVAFDRPKAVLGLQPDNIGDTRLWLLPSPSGLNAHFQLAGLGKLFRELREAAATFPPARPRT